MTTDTHTTDTTKTDTDHTTDIAYYTVDTEHVPCLVRADEVPDDRSCYVRTLCDKRVHSTEVEAYDDDWTDDGELHTECIARAKSAKRRANRKAEQEAIEREREERRAFEQAKREAISREIAERVAYDEGEMVTFEWTDGSLKTGTIERFWVDTHADDPDTASVSVTGPDWPRGQTYDIAVAWIRAGERDFDVDAAK